MYTFKNDFILYTKTKFGIKNFRFAFDPHVQGFQARAAAGLGLETAVFFPFLYAGPENPKKTRSQVLGSVFCDTALNLQLGLLTALLPLQPLDQYITVIFMRFLL